MVTLKSIKIYFSIARDIIKQNICHVVGIMTTEEVTVPLLLLYKTYSVSLFGGF